MTNQQGKVFLEAVQSREPVSGLTHDFYRYPARFSPRFARAAIESFSDPGDTVLDPFVGGGTTLVEALATGRDAVGSDISSLAQFVSAIKTTTLSENDLTAVTDWTLAVMEKLNIHGPNARAMNWAEAGYQKDLPWRLRKILELMLASLPRLTVYRQQRFARCVVLRLGQWALDCKQHLPTVEEFRQEIPRFLDIFIDGMREFREELFVSRDVEKQSALIVQCKASKLPEVIDVRGCRPKLVVTSPPYAGVYVLYHRWKIRGRRETPAPFWVADCRDGHGQAHYCFGDRKQRDLSQYFDGIRESFAGVRRVVSSNALVVQIVAFANPDKHVSRYLKVMKDAGFEEVMPGDLGIPRRRRIWRRVPGRKWFARLHGDLSSSREVVLFHRPA